MSKLNYVGENSKTDTNKDFEDSTFNLNAVRNSGNMVGSFYFLNFYHAMKFSSRDGAVFGSILKF